MLNLQRNILQEKSQKKKFKLNNYEGWMVSGQENSFLLGSSSIANHGGYLSW
jgi:hypothetical protein